MLRRSLAAASSIMARSANDNRNWKDVDAFCASGLTGRPGFFAIGLTSRLPGLYLSLQKSGALPYNDSEGREKPGAPGCFALSRRVPPRRGPARRRSAIPTPSRSCRALGITVGQPVKLSAPTYRFGHLADPTGRARAPCPRNGALARAGEAAAQRSTFCTRAAACSTKPAPATPLRIWTVRKRPPPSREARRCKPRRSRTRGPQRPGNRAGTEGAACLDKRTSGSVGPAVGPKLLTEP